MKHNLIFISLLLLCVAAPHGWSANRVLSLDGGGDYVEISDSLSLNAINSQVTMEAWIKLAKFPNQWISIIYKGDKRTENLSNRSYYLQLNSSGFIELTSAPTGKGQFSLFSQGSLIALNTVRRKKSCQRFNLISTQLPRNRK